MEKECCFRLSRRLWGGRDEKRAPLKTPAWEASPVLAVSKTQGKCQLSVNPIQTLLLLSCLVIVVYNRPLQAKL